MSHRSTEEDFAAFYARTVRYVWSSLRRHGITREADREELAQEVYLAAHRKLGPRPAGAVLSWLGVTAWHIARRHVGLARTRKEQPMNEPATGEPATGKPAADALVAGDPSAEDALDVLGRYQVLAKGMPDECRVIFELHEIDGQGLPDIAEALEIPLGTATSRLRRAREHLMAAAVRLEAREALAEGRAPRMLPLLLPFGAGAWSQAARLGDAPPAGVQERIWSGILRELARAALVGGSVAGAAVLGKATAGALFGAGVATGVTGLAGVLVGLHLLAPAPPVSISSAPDAVPATLAPSALVPASAAPANAAPLAVPVAAVAPSREVAAADKADPEEKRILRRAWITFAGGDLDATRDALAEHARRFPPGRARLAKEAGDLRAQLDAASLSTHAGHEPPRPDTEDP